MQELPGEKSYPWPALIRRNFSLTELSNLPCFRHLVICTALALLGTWSGENSVALADVAVLCNRTGRELVVEIMPGVGAAKSMAITSGESRPVFFQGFARVRFGDQFASQSYELAPKAAYFFAPDGQTVRMERIGFGPSDSEPLKPVPFDPNQKLSEGAVTVPIKIAVDDDEPTHRTVWEPRLRDRIAKASQILEQHCGVKLEIVDVATWESNNQIRDFSRSMREFERAVPATPAQLVIGFSSQYDFSVGPMHLGGSRGPLHPHILLKERAPNTQEAEKLELLVHELSHFLGASHSPEPHSVMRPMLTFSQLRSTGSKIYIDPVNVLLMSLMADEMRQNKVKTFAEVSQPTKDRMLEIYRVLQQALPNDPAAIVYQRLLGTSNTPQLAMEVREILSQLSQFARLEQARAEKAGVKIAGDDLTASYVREAAVIAADLQSPTAAKSMLLALGVFFDDVGTLRTFPGTSSLVSQLETDEQRRTRIDVLGHPTMRDRPDLVKHFFVSAHLAATMGGSAARGMGLMKETLDAQGGSGFSFADMAANRAGIVFAEKLLANELTLDELTNSFVVGNFIPEIGELVEGLQGGDLQSHLKKAETTLTAELDQIEQRILDLPIYQKTIRNSRQP